MGRTRGMVAQLGRGGRTPLALVLLFHETTHHRGEAFRLIFGPFKHLWLHHNIRPHVALSRAPGFFTFGNRS